MAGRVVNRIRRLGPLRIEGYRSFGPASAVMFKGRVLANRPIEAATVGESRVRAVGRMIERFLTREVAGVEVDVAVGSTSAAAVTDSEGYFSVALALQGVAAGDSVVAVARITCSRSRDTWPIPGLVVGDEITRVLISDVDDTLLLNGMGDVVRTVLATLGGSALTREPVPGSSVLYRRLAGGAPAHPAAVFYVSSSPWNLYGFIEAFLTHHAFPLGPLLLRDFGMNVALAGGSHGSHKVDGIATILEACPAARVLMIGDTSQQDAHAFAEISERWPDRIVGSFLRDVGDPDKAAAVRSIAADLPDRAGPMTVVQDMSEIEGLAAAAGWFD